MGKQIWLVPSDADRKTIDGFKNWAWTKGTETKFEIEDGMIQTYPHITVLSFKEDAQVDDIVAMLQARNTSESAAKPSSLKLDLHFSESVESEDEFWRTAYQPISSINVSGQSTDIKGKILDFFANTLNIDVVDVTKEPAKTIASNKVTKWAPYKDPPAIVKDATRRRKYPHFALAYTEEGGKDRTKRVEIANHLTTLVGKRFPNKKITVDRIWVVDCPHSYPEPNSEGVKCMPTWDAIKNTKVEFKLKDVPGLAEALQSQ